MRKKYLLNSYFILFILFISTTIFSCATRKNIKYFEDIPDSGVLKTIPITAYIEPKIQVDDILSIVVSTVDPAATQPINLGNISLLGPNNNGPATSQPVISGYLVSKDGDVEIPVLGKIHLLGLTTVEARGAIKERANKFYNDPSVTVRYANFKITVTGEVARPSVYIMPNEKVTLLDALSIAGDLTIYGKRDNILLLRENNDGSKTAYRINLTKSNLIDQPYYYLHQNDYIYVEPTKGKVAANDIAQARTYAILSSVITVIIVIISRINFK
ncbi:polysaccharide biosynthesis/export family protein [Mucilaginibacter sp. X5P1]|uniref:polysaccharide biosynthesis/export family protein n=1 Tax=Mucilaginibacter sp. X5P1 TaxID=2723088 RepID=UPI00161695F0|nr:polysaccharide biosynthesis/export family protein [Mucilaginibacter sp. X5P1]MBB6141226.1 polysaccharide export outer membrane protein [Mucilaginibacter sp. X5P1]